MAQQRLQHEVEAGQRTGVGLRRHQVGVQAHCLRRELTTDIHGTLGELAAMGFESIELCSFPGCAGNPWGNFGHLADWRPGQIRAALDRAGLTCMATHVTAAELEPGRLDETLRWAEGVGTDTLVLAGLARPGGDDLLAWRSAFQELNALGARLSGAGFRFAYHTQIDIWRSIDGCWLARELLETIDPQVCRVELDPSGSLVHGTDWMSLVPDFHGLFFALHLRDGIRPPQPVPYLPAVPLGEGDEDWPAAIRAATDAGIRTAFLEMEVEAGRDVFRALRSSLDHLRSIGQLGDDVERIAS